MPGTVLNTASVEAERDRCRAEVAKVQAEIGRLVAALASGVAVDSIAVGLRARETAKLALQADAERLDDRIRAARAAQA